MTPGQITDTGRKLIPVLYSMAAAVTPPWKSMYRIVVIGADQKRKVRDQRKLRDKHIAPESDLGAPDV